MESSQPQKESKLESKNLFFSYPKLTESINSVSQNLVPLPSLGLYRWFLLLIERIKTLSYQYSNLTFLPTTFTPAFVVSEVVCFFPLTFQLFQ